MREFNNIELKRSSWLLIITTVVFFVITVLCLNFFLTQIKSSYIEKMVQVATIVIEKTPEAKEDVLQVIAGTKVVDGEKGRSVLEAREMDSSLGYIFFRELTVSSRMGALHLP